MEIIKDTLNEKAKNQQQIYYHYTTIKALYKIISSKCLWLTSLSSANDSKELYYTKQELKNTFENIINEEEKSDFKDFLINWHKNINYEKINNSSKYYALSLTNKRNNLTHWRSYGNQCSGICLAINLGVFNAYEKLINDDSVSKIIQINKISYTDQDKKTLIKEFFILAYNFIKESKKKIDYEFITNTLYACILPFIKTNFFFDESEIRLLFNSFILDFYDKFPNISFSTKILKSFNLIETKYKDMGDEIRSYKEMNLEPVWCPSLFPEIILGPHSYQNINELKDFLNAYGLTDTKISISEVPIR